jgi:hypothetical protein
MSAYDPKQKWIAPQLSGISSPCSATYHAPYDRFQAFWTSFIDYQRDCNSPNRWSEGSVFGQAWHRGAEAAMRLHWERYSCPYARDDLDSLKQCATLDRLIEERKAT